MAPGEGEGGIRYESAVTFPARVLVIEDEPDVAAVLRFGLEAAGAREVVVSGDGHEGLALARKGTFDLVLCDLMLPGLDGLDVCRRLRAGEPVVDAPVIFVTAAAGQAFRARTPADYGAVGVLPKPFDVVRLGADIAAILAGAAPAIRAPRPLPP